MIIKKTITIGKSLNGGINESKSLSSIVLEVFFTIFFTLLTKTFAKIPLMSKAKITAKKNNT